MSKKSEHSFRNFLEFISLLILLGLAVKKLLQWAKQWEQGSQEQGLVNEVMKFVQQQIGEKTVPAKKVAKPATKIVKKSTPRIHSLNLNTRQEQIYNILRERGEATMAALTKSFPSVSSRTLRRDMTQLEKLGLVSQSGRTKNSVYKLK